MTNQKFFVLIFFTVAFFISFGLFNIFNGPIGGNISYELVYGSENDDCNLKTFHYTIDGVQNNIKFDYMIKQFHYWAFYDCNHKLVYRFNTKHLKLKPKKHEKSI